MNIYKLRNVSMSTLHPLEVYVFADTHIGTLNFDEKKLRRHIKYCKDEGAYWVHLGDWCEAISPKDKRFDTRFSVLNHITEQYEKAYELFEPIKDQCLGVINGNHDEFISKNIGDLLKTIVVKPLGITNQYLGSNGFIYVQAAFPKRAKCVFYLTHGWGKGRLIGSKSLKLQRLSHSFDADVYLIGHMHTYITHTDEYLGVRRGKLRELKRHYMSAPSYYQAYGVGFDGYAEKAGYPPQPTGCVKLTITQREDYLDCYSLPFWR